MSRIDEARWQDAQRAEHAYWYPASEPQRTTRWAEERARHMWIAELLGITAEAVTGRAVLDIGGGPLPISGWPELPLARRVVLDPMDVRPDADALVGLERVRLPAELNTVAGAWVDEVWGYNVLQHVMDPAAVLATAMRSARQVIRWFEWLDQARTVVHPHTVTRETFATLADAGWICDRRVEGERDEGRGWRQAYLATVWVTP